MITSLKPVFVKNIPGHEDPKEEGVLYISEDYHTSMHLCACGCKEPVHLPFSHIVDGKDHGWVYTRELGDLITFTPSIGNRAPGPYHAHYHIQRNRIVWVEPIRPELIRKFN